MKIFYYEVLKILQKKSFYIIVLMLFITNLFLYYSNEIKYENILINNKEYYYDLENQFKDKNSSRALEELRLREEKLMNYGLLSSYENHENSMYLIEDMEKKNTNIINDFSQSEYSNDPDKLMIDTYLISLLRNQAEYISTYDDYINSIDEKAKELTSISIFYDEDSFSHKNIQKTPKDFQHLKGIDLSMGIGDGITTSTNFVITDIFIISIVFILCIYLFLIEREKMLIPLIKSNKKGRLNVIVAKIITLVIFTTVLSLIFYGSILLLGKSIYGFGDTSRYIQSISNFRECTILMTVKEYLILFLTCKVISILVLGFILTFIFLILRNSMEIYLASALILILSVLGYVMISVTSYMNIFKYVNIFYFLNAYELLGRYVNVNILGKPVDVKLLYIVVSLIILIALFVINSFLFVKFTGNNKTSLVESFITNFKMKVFKYKGTSNLFLQEGYKIFIFNKVALIIIIVTLFLGNRVISIEKFFTSDEATYKNYIAILNGELTEEKENYINEEKERFENLALEYDKLDAMYENKEISAEEHYSRGNKLSLISKKEKIFNEILNQYEYVLELKEEKNIDAHFVDMTAYNNLFNSNKDYLVMGILIMIILIISLSNVLAMDLKNGAIKIIGSSKHGRTKGVIYKYLISFIVIIVVVAIFNISNYAIVYKLYGINNLNAPIQSIQLFNSFPFKISIFSFIALKDFLMLLGLMIMGICILMISTVLRNYTLAIIVSSIIFIIPLIIGIVGIDILNYFTLSNVFLLSSTLASSKGIIINIVYYLVLSIIAMIAVRITCIKYSNDSRKD